YAFLFNDHILLCTTKKNSVLNLPRIAQKESESDFNMDDIEFPAVSGSDSSTYDRIRAKRKANRFVYKQFIKLDPNDTQIVEQSPSSTDEASQKQITLVRTVSSIDIYSLSLSLSLIVLTYI